MKYEIYEIGELASQLNGLIERPDSAQLLSEVLETEELEKLKAMLEDYMELLYSSGKVTPVPVLDISCPDCEGRHFKILTLPELITFRDGNKLFVELLRTRCADCGLTFVSPHQARENEKTIARLRKDPFTFLTSVISGSIQSYSCKNESGVLWEKLWRNVNGKIESKVCVSGCFDDWHTYSYEEALEIIKADFELIYGDKP